MFIELAKKYAESKKKHIVPVPCSLKPRRLLME